MSRPVCPRLTLQSRPDRRLLVRLLLDLVKTHVFTPRGRRTDWADLLFITRNQARRAISSGTVSPAETPNGNRAMPDTGLSADSVTKLAGVTFAPTA